MWGIFTSLSYLLRQNIRWQGLSLSQPLPETLAESNGILDLLNQIPFHLLNPLRSFTSLKAVDIGAKNWAYLPGLASWLSSQFPHKNIQMTGIEVDAFRIYRNLRTRYSSGKFFMRQCASSHMNFTYQSGDIREYSQPRDLITWFFPFLAKETHLAWGLPPRLFDPQSLVEHVHKMMLTHSILILTNQGEWEWEETVGLFREFRLLYIKKIENSLHASPYPIFLSIWRP